MVGERRLGKLGFWNLHPRTRRGVWVSGTWKLELAQATASGAPSGSCETGTLEFTKHGRGARERWKLEAGNLIQSLVKISIDPVEASRPDVCIGTSFNVAVGSGMLSMGRLEVGNLRFSDSPGSLDNMRITLAACA